MKRAPVQYLLFLMFKIDIYDLKRELIIGFKFSRMGKFICSICTLFYTVTHCDRRRGSRFDKSSGQWPEFIFWICLLDTTGVSLVSFCLITESK